MQSKSCGLSLKTIEEEELIHNKELKAATDDSDTENTCNADSSLESSE